MDPDEHKGTAKFVQHMLFKGSKKYPKHTQYEDFMQKNGGEWNSYTTMINTNFQFEVNNNVFEEALDRFANFLIAPMFNKEATAKEIKTIHHQFKVALTNDFWHHTNLYMQLSDPESAIQKFMFGNKEGLKKPEAYKAMQDFYNEYYSADIMTLCVSSNKKLSEMESLVSKHFKPMLNKKVQLPDFGNFDSYPLPYTP